MSRISVVAGKIGSASPAPNSLIAGMRQKKESIPPANR
jgi:hypothetical protein